MVTTAKISPVRGVEDVLLEPESIVVDVKNVAEEV